MPAPRHAESPLEPGLEIVDAHHHLWPEPHHQFGAYDLEDLRADTGAGHDVRATVYVEASSAYRTDGPPAFRPVGETEWVAALDGGPQAIIAHADMFLGAEVGPVLDAHVAAGGGRFKGIRHPIAWDPSPEVRPSSKAPPPRAAADPQFRHGVAEVAARGLVFETWGWFHQLADLADLAAAQPDLTVVCDHLGGPVTAGPYAADRPRTLHAWRTAIETLAAQPNVVLKIGGLGFEPLLPAEVRDRPVASERLAAFWQPEIDFCLQTFGPGRCMAESNFPVDRATCDYGTLWNAFKRLTAHLPAADRAQVLAGTARRVYAL